MKSISTLYKNLWNRSSGWFHSPRFLWSLMSFFRQAQWWTIDSAKFERWNPCSRLNVNSFRNYWTFLKPLSWFISPAKSRTNAHVVSSPGATTNHRGGLLKMIKSMFVIENKLFLQYYEVFVSALVVDYISKDLNESLFHLSARHNNGQ